MNASYEGHPRSKDGKDSAAEFARFDEPRKSALKKLQRVLHANPIIVPVVVLGIAVATFSAIVGQRFFHPFNLSLILQQVTVIGIIGVAQTLVILTAGIDLSVGAIMILATVVAGNLAVISGIPSGIAMVVGLSIGAMCGAANGGLIVYARLPPFIVTLGAWSVFGALVLWYSQSQTIRSQDVSAVAPLLQLTGTSFDVFGALFTIGTLLMLVISAIVSVMLNRTAFGTHIRATGNDPTAARLSGINTHGTLLAVYTIAGILCAIGAWIQIGRVGAISPTSGTTVNLDSITATVIGGTSLFGGRGSIAGTLIGALIVGVFRNGLALTQLDALWQEFTIGLLIVFAVALDQWIRRVSA